MAQAAASLRPLKMFATLRATFFAPSFTLPPKWITSRAASATQEDGKGCS